MFILRLFQLVFLLMLAFVAGIFVERSHQINLCEQSGGIWIRAGFCGEK
ncbi:MAG: hypothetical protein ACK5LJ_10990 [Paracoccus sp. (in: a-proteobacteria)]